MARVQVGVMSHYTPTAVDAYVLDADDLAAFRAQTSAATTTEDTSLLSIAVTQDA